ncbi:MAG: triose-phosphate isomerase [Planctomycetota bacterium]
MRRPFVAGNWKMNLNLPEARGLVTQIRKGIDAETAQGIDMAVCPPFVYLFPLAETTLAGPLALGAQDLYHEPRGAFTGEISAAMVAESGAKYVIIGHSERRHTISHHEDDRMINLKLHAARSVDLIPILCVGETLVERKAEQTLDVLTFQLQAALVGAQVNSATDLVIAYEPVWAIGTGEVATPPQAQEAHAHLRNELRSLLGAIADNVRILYGGSVKPDNAPEIMALPDVDGGLIGGASLQAEPFLAIIAATLAAKR